MDGFKQDVVVLMRYISVRKVSDHPEKSVAQMEVQCTKCEHSVFFPADPIKY